MPIKSTAFPKTLSYSPDYITSRGSGSLNEDAFICNPNKGLFAVFDGVTSLNPFIDATGKTGGWIASHTAVRIFEASKKTFSATVKDANIAIRDAMTSEGVDISDKLNLWATSVAAIKLKRDSFDWVQVSDTNIIAIYKDGSYKLLVKDYEHDMESLLMLKKFVDSGATNPRAAIQGQLELNRRNSNITYGFIAGDKDVKFMHTGTESTEAVSDILIFSDGLLIPKTDPSKPDDMGAIVKEYLGGGLEGWLSKVRALEDSDPECRKYMRFKPHDDATAIAVSLRQS
ncbi:MAG TPA: protein phosphatase 2C domain-containing protein [Candidatus Acidoferrales bacterium]|nr:protein phosphatase 2C domain-containing protein [Candidatus Acidoferrales bacterium]